MERDCMIAHGAARMLKERLFDVSDKYSVHVCRNCGLIAVANLRKDFFRCKRCDSGSNVYQVHIPYAFKLLVHELMAMNLAPRLMPTLT